jgi:uncharacterized protein YjiS (DUF1127 family)
MLLNLKNNAIWAKVKNWREISKQRNELRMLSDHLIKDVGLSRVDLEREASRPFWDNAPCYDDSLQKRSSTNQDTRVEKLRLNKCFQP